MELSITADSIKADLELHEFCGLQWHWPLEHGEDIAERIRVANGYSNQVNAMYGYLYRMGLPAHEIITEYGILEVEKQPAK